VLGLDLLGQAFARVPPGQADDLIAGLQTLIEAAGHPGQHRRPPLAPGQPPTGSEGDSGDDDHPGL
jgi:hypothetical protein